MLKQREQTANLAVQQEQEEQAAQSFTPYWNFSMIDDEEERFFEIKHAFTDEQYQQEDIQELMCKLLDDVRNISEELAEYINSPSWNHPTFYDNDEEHSIQYKEYLKSSSNAITTVLPTEEPEYSFSMGEYEVTSDDESECDVPVKDESSPIFTTFSNPIFDCNDDFTFSDDESLSNEDVLMENFKVYSNPFFDDEEVNSDKIDPHYFNTESDLIESLSNRDTLFDSSPKFDYLEEFSGELMPTSITLPTSTIPIEDNDSLREEIDIFTGTDDLMPPGIKSDNYESEGDIYFLEELLVNDSISLPVNESSNFDHHDDSSFPRPPPEPPDVEVFFDFEPNSGEIDVFANVEDEEYFTFIFVIRIFLPYITYPEASPLLLSTRSKDTIFDPGILT
nr:hypothetical protein [Tanacetum cinerariifolium]